MKDFASAGLNRYRIRKGTYGSTGTVRVTSVQDPRSSANLSIRVGGDEGNTLTVSLGQGDLLELVGALSAVWAMKNL